MVSCCISNRRRSKTPGKTLQQARKLALGAFRCTESNPAGSVLLRARHQLRSATAHELAQRLRSGRTGIVNHGALALGIGEDRRRAQLHHARHIRRARNRLSQRKPGTKVHPAKLANPDAPANDPCGAQTPPPACSAPTTRYTFGKGSTMKPQLYGTPLSHFTRKLRVSMSELGVEFDFVRAPACWPRTQRRTATIPDFACRRWCTAAIR